MRQRCGPALLVRLCPATPPQVSPRHRAPSQEAAVRIGIPRESRPGETLVAATAKTASQLAGLGYDVVVEQGAGERRPTSPTRPSPTPGCAVGTGRGGLVAATSSSRSTSRRATRSAGCATGATVIARMAPATSRSCSSRWSAQGVTGARMDAIPRISRAQSMDVLSTMSNIAGYRGVIEAARVRRHVHRPGHRGGQDPTGHASSSSAPVLPGWPRSARRSPGRQRAGVRRPPRGRRADRVDGRAVRLRRAWTAGGLAPTATPRS